MSEVATERVEYVETTPSGIEILYSPRPRRLYELRNPLRMRESTGAGGDIHPLDESEWVEVPSVTKILDVLGGPPAWWGMQVGVAGVLALMREGEPLYADQTADDVIDLLKQYKLTTNDARDSGRDRGLAIHDAFEAWAKYGLKPNPGDFPEEQQGYARALLQFLEHLPSAEPIACEVMVGSIEHQFAGRYDIRFRTHEPHQIVKHRTPVRGPQWATLQPGEYIADLKTSGKIMPKFHAQLAAYELASVECGYQPTEARGIIRVSADGDYVFTRCKAEAEDFLAIRRAYEALRRLK